MEDETLNFICWITGHDKDTIHQMWNDYFNSPQSKVSRVELPVIKKTTNQIENQLMVITDQEEIKALNKQLIKLLDEINKRGQLDWASIKVFIKMQQEQISNLTKAFENVVKLAQEQNLI